VQTTIEDKAAAAAVSGRCMCVVNVFLMLLLLLGLSTLVRARRSYDLTQVALQAGMVANSPPFAHKSEIKG
jgi:hypothetical protein